jgi:hypothetical protein
MHLFIVILFTQKAYCPPELYDYGGVLDDNVVDQRVDIWVRDTFFFLFLVLLLIS